MDLSQAIAYDIETTGLWPHKHDFIIASISDYTNTELYHNLEDAKERILRLPKWQHPLVGANLQFDLRFSDMLTVPQPILDVTKIAHMVDENTPHTLKWLAKRYLGKDMRKPISKKSGTDDELQWELHSGEKVPMTDERIKDEIEEYVGEDTATPLELLPKLWHRLTPKQKAWYLNVEDEYSRALGEMEAKGIGIDEEAWFSYRQDLEEQLPGLETGVYNALEYELLLSSPLQVGQALFEKEWYTYDRELRQIGFCKTCEHGKGLSKKDGSLLCKVEDCEGLKPKYKYFEVPIPHKGLGLKSFKETDGKAPSTDDDALSYHEDVEVVKRLLDYREVNKVLTTYLRPYDRFYFNGRIFGHFNGCGTVSGRLSASKPNLTNIPARGPLGAKMRGLFVPKGKDRVFVVGDLDQVELRILAWASGEPSLISGFNDPGKLECEWKQNEETRLAREALSSLRTYVWSEVGREYRQVPVGKLAAEQVVLQDMPLFLSDSPEMVALRGSLQSILQGWANQDPSRLLSDLVTQPPGSGQGPVHMGAPVGDGAETRSLLAYVGGRASREWEQAGQPTGELSGSSESDTPCPNCGRLPKCKLVPFDPHSLNASVILGRWPESKDERTIFGKNMGSFARVYGAGPDKIATMARVAGMHMTREDAIYYMALLNEGQAHIAAWKERILAECKAQMFVELPSGRRRNLPTIRSKKWNERGYAERQAVNSYIQGTAADILKLMTVFMRRSGFVPVVSVHDELVFEVSEESAPLVIELMSESATYAAHYLGIKNVPITCEAKMCSRWSEKE